MTDNRLLLEGRHIRLEPLSRDHIDGLLAARASGGELYRWTTVPDTRVDMEAYVDAALSARDRGAAHPFATLRSADGKVIGSTRLFDFAFWPWPADHPRHARALPDTAEIGYTWLAADAIRTGANTEAKLLMLEQAFERWELYSVCFHTDARNARSRAALEGIGARFEGILRSHRMSVEFGPRDSARFSITSNEWPDVKAHLLRKLGQGG